MPVFAHLFTPSLKGQALCSHHHCTHTQRALGDSTFWFLFLETIACNRNFTPSCIKMCNLHTLKRLTSDMVLFPASMWCPQYLRDAHDCWYRGAWPHSLCARGARSQHTSIKVLWDKCASGGNGKCQTVTIAISLMVLFQLFVLSLLLLSLGNSYRFLLLKSV